VAKEYLLDWKTVKALEIGYMREQIKRARHPRPKVLGIDEISIRKGQTYRIVDRIVVSRERLGATARYLVRRQGPL